MKCWWRRRNRLDVKLGEDVVVIRRSSNRVREGRQQTGVNGCNDKIKGIVAFMSWKRDVLNQIGSR
jgi:hypothetical protein